MNACTRSSFLLLAVLLVPTGCDRAPDGWTPVLEETSTAYLETELERTLDRVVAARERVRSDPNRAEELLETAGRGLRGLRDTYVPLLRARASAYNAYRYHFLERRAEAAAALEWIEETVLAVSEGAQGALLAELEEIDELVADARVELQAGSPGAADALRALATALDDFVAKSDLFL